jgi:hypothetical protein
VAYSCPSLLVQVWAPGPDRRNPHPASGLHRTQHVRALSVWPAHASESPDHAHSAGLGRLTSGCKPAQGRWHLGESSRNTLSLVIEHMFDTNVALRQIPVPQGTDDRLQPARRVLGAFAGPMVRSGPAVASITASGVAPPVWQDSKRRSDLLAVVAFRRCGPASSPSC